MSVGFFDLNAAPEGWFDKNASPLGWFDRALTDAASGTPPTITTQPTDQISDPTVSRSEVAGFEICSTSATNNDDVFEVFRLRGGGASSEE